MKHRLIATLAAASLALTATPHAFAAASPSTTVTHDATSSFPDVNPCTWAPGTSTVTEHTVFHMTERPGGTLSVAGTATGTITFVPQDSSQPTYTGHFSQSYGGSGVIDPATGALSVGEETATYTVHVTGTDGSRLTYHEVSHETVNPDGTVTVSFDRPTATCG